jgi:predicted P-loop ATPase/GTPase
VLKGGTLKSVFVFGLFEDSPGKTTFSCGLLHKLQQIGLNPVPLKARAGHNYWYQYNELTPCLKEGRLYCSDIIKLKQASRAEEPYETLNPIDTLITPPLDTMYYIKNKNTRTLYLSHQDVFNKLAVERYTVIRKNKPFHTFLLKEAPSHLTPKETIEKITAKADMTLKIENLEDWTRFYQQNADEAINSCTDSLKNHPVMVSEGFCDIIYPVPRMDHDVVVAVAPGVVILYDPKRFSKAVQYNTVEGKKEFKASEVIQYLKPVKMHRIPVLTQLELRDLDKLAGAYIDPIETVIRQLQL